MDNAAKALLIAGGVLLSIIVISIFMLMFNSLTDYQRSQTDLQVQSQLNAFNNQYQAYVRNNVRGNEIESLINKVVHYNRTQSSAGTGTLDFGSSVGYEPITLIIDIGDPNAFGTATGINNLFNQKEYVFNATGSIRNSNADGFNLIDAIKKAQMPGSPTSGDTFYYNEGNLQALLAHKNSEKSLFISNTDFSNLDRQEKLKRVYDFNVCVGKTYFNLIIQSGLHKGEAVNDTQLNTWHSRYFSGTRPETTRINGINGINMTIEQVLDYYSQYTQFKRALFQCETEETLTDGTKISLPQFSDKTGRIIRMKFTFTGEFD